MDLLPDHPEKAAPDQKAKFVWNTPKRENLQMTMMTKKKANT